MNPFISIRVGAAIRNLSEPFEQALEKAHEPIATIHRDHWKHKVMTVVGGPANKIAYITGAYVRAIELGKRTREGSTRIIDVQSDLYQDQSVLMARYPGIGRLIERGGPGYPGRFQAELAIQSARADVEAELDEHMLAATQRIERG